MTKCSHCGVNGHNSRTCDDKGEDCLRLFGVNIKKSLSLGDLEGYGRKSRTGRVDRYGYHSDEDHSVRGRRKGRPWTVDEHRKFLSGLMRLGKGDWRGISRNFVRSRTPTQVASHAQKYFMRKHVSADKKKRRASVFDMTLQDFPNTSAPLAFKEAFESQQKNNATAQLTNRFPHLSLEKRPANPTMQPGHPGCLPKPSPCMAKIPDWTTYLAPGHPYLAQHNAGIGKLSPCAAVHPKQSFPKPPFPPSASTSKGPSRLDLGLKFGE